MNKVNHVCIWSKSNANSIRAIIKTPIQHPAKINSIYELPFLSLNNNVTYEKENTYYNAGGNTHIFLIYHVYSFFIMNKYLYK